MSDFFTVDKEEAQRIAYLQNLFDGLPAEDDPAFETFSEYEQDFLASTRRQFDIWQELSLRQEEILAELWLKQQERTVPSWRLKV